MPKRILLIVLLSLAACSDGASDVPVDASALDASALDAAPRDDAATIDARVPDASTPDASGPDASAIDASEPDASEPDAGGCVDDDDDDVCDDVDPCIGEPLFRETFETGGASFSLNTERLAGAVGGTNRWVINDAYEGGTGSLVCLGFPFTFFVADTATQLVEIDGAPTSQYLHIASRHAISSGFEGSSYTAADGTCFQAETNFAEMNVDLDTSDLVNVSVGFWHLVGGASTSYGEVYFSTDGGANWTLLMSPRASYFGVTEWTRATAIEAALAGHETVRLGFRFVNALSVEAADPAFSIDDIEICAAGALVE